MTVDLTEKFDKILQGFDFWEVRKIMELMDWKWATAAGYHIPDVDEMKESCCTLFDHTLEEYQGREDFCSIGTGGFTVTIYKNKNIVLEFIPIYLTYDSEIDEVY